MSDLEAMARAGSRRSAGAAAFRAASSASRALRRETTVASICLSRRFRSRPLAARSSLGRSFTALSSDVAFALRAENTRSSAWLNAFLVQGMSFSGSIGSLCYNGLSNHLPPHAPQVYGLAEWPALAFSALFELSPLELLRPSYRREPYDLGLPSACRQAVAKSLRRAPSRLDFDYCLLNINAIGFSLVGRKLELSRRSLVIRPSSPTNSASMPPAPSGVVVDLIWSVNSEKILSASWPGLSLIPVSLSDRQMKKPRPSHTGTKAEIPRYHPRFPRRQDNSSLIREITRTRGHEAGDRPRPTNVQPRGSGELRRVDRERGLQPESAPLCPSYPAYSSPSQPCDMQLGRV